MFYLYLHLKPDGDPFYVGKGVKWRSREFWHRNVHHQRIVAVYGRENIEILTFPRDSEEEAYRDEQLWIARLREQGYRLANMTSGGDGGALGVSPSADTRAKLSAALKGKTKSEETRRKMSAAAMGNRKGGFAKTAETRAKIAAALAGNTNSAGNQNCAGKTLSPEHRSRIGAGSKAAWERRRRDPKPDPIGD